MAKSNTGSSEALRDRKICFRLTGVEYDRFRLLVEAEYGTAANAASRFIREHIFLENNIKLVRQIWSDTRAMKADIELLLRQLQHDNNFPAYSRLSDILTKTELQLDRIVGSFPRWMRIMKTRRARKEVTRMAITKITNIGENRGAGSRAAHLKNALKYIMNPKKTEDMTLVGSNCGVDPGECFERMMETKEIYGKTGGRQGYHIVISFKPGECDEATAMAIGRDFCEQYLGDDYDYAYAVHNDQAHMHIHIVFNSVNRSNTLKYHYSNGDWEKSIQPITDELCRKYGLSILEYDKSAPRVGRTYAEHMAEKNGKLTWTDIIQADIDFAISQTSTESDFMTFMKSMGYSIRIGHSGKYGEYAAYTAPGESDRNRDRTRRDYKLGEGYRLPDIRKRLAAPDKTLPEVPPPFEPEAYAAGLLTATDAATPDENAAVFSEGAAGSFAEDLAAEGSPRGLVFDDLKYSSPGRPLTKFQVVFVRRIWLANNFRFLILREDEQARTRQDLIKLQNLTEQCDYILQHGITSLEAAEDRLAAVKAAIRNARASHDEFAVDKMCSEKRILIRITKHYDELNYAEDKGLRSDILFANTEKRLEYQEKRKEDRRQRELQEEKPPASPLRKAASAKVPTNRGFAGPSGPNETINLYVKKKE